MPPVLKSIFTFRTWTPNCIVETKIRKQMQFMEAELLALEAKINIIFEKARKTGEKKFKNFDFCLQTLVVAIFFHF